MAIPARLCRCRATREKFHKGCDALGWNSFPTPQAALSRPFNGRKPTVISAFAQQHGDPTGTRSSALNVFIPDAVATGRYDLRPDCYVRELTRRPRRQGQGGGLPGRRRRHRRAGGRPLHPRLRRDGDRAPSAAVEVRPLPERPRQWQRPRRAQRHLPRIQRGRRPLRRTDLRLGRRRLCQRLQLPVLRARRQPRLRQRRPHRVRRRRHSAADQLAPARQRRPGARRPSRTTATTSTTRMAVAMVLHDMPQHDNRVDLDDRSSTPGACRSRG